MLAIASSGAARTAQAQAEHAREQQPARYLASASIGVPLRLTHDTDLGQHRLAPAFTDVMGGYVLPGSSRLRHGAGLGLSLNLNHDGGYMEPVRAFQQFVVMPSYLLYYEAGRDFYGVGHVGIPVVVHERTTAGAEVAWALGYRWLAGFGGFGEAAIDFFPGASSSMHLMFSLEVGMFVDYEVLP